MKKPLLSLLFALSLSCGAGAQVPGQGIGVPSNPPGVQANLNASIDPTSSNDSTQGYSVGSIWQNSSTGRVWIARSVSTGAAKWNLLELSDHPGYIASNWYLPYGPNTISAGAVPGASSIRLFPAYIKERITLNFLGVRVTTLSAGGNIQAAIYANNPATMRPTGTVLASTASMSTASLASVNAAVSVQLEPGLYWFATNCDNGTAIFDSVAGSNTTFSGSLIGSATQAFILGGSATTLSGLSVAQTFGTWPDLSAASFTEVVGSSSIPVVQFEVGSVP